jgi:excisionase family DNA binding protein
MYSVVELVRRMTPVAVPAEQQSEVAALLAALEQLDDATMRHLLGAQGERISIPETVFIILERVVEVMARGDAVTVVPASREVTTQQAADMLHVSRQYLIRLLDDGRIPYRLTGKHRRLKAQDVLAYKESRDRDRRAGLRELTRLTEEFGGYAEELIVK